MDRKICCSRLTSQRSAGPLRDTTMDSLFTTYIGDGEDSTPEDGILLCYTDRSGQGAGTGSGLAVYTDNQAQPVYTNMEYTGKDKVFHAELRAIQMSCKFAETQPHTKMLILSDSQANIQASVFPLIRSRTVLQTVNILNKLAATGKLVCLQWVRGQIAQPTA
jgi:ribonuclease HI